MYLLYLDDAGSVSNSSDTHVVLAGIALFERQVHFLDGLLSSLAAEIAPEAPHELEFHANHMQAGKGFSPFSGHFVMLFLFHRIAIFIFYQQS